MVRVRFAPSPTGYLHIGAARTALFNWLFARRQQGKFILRIEDTDFARSSEEMSRGILEGLEWLGLDWDEGPIFQSKRIAIYQKVAEELVREGKAYYCYCLPEEIHKRKEVCLSQGQYWKYDRLCLSLGEKDREKLEKEGRKKAIRFFIPEGKTEFLDLIHGPISVDNSSLEDFVLLRGDGLPTYHLSVVVDDSESEITHVIRGDDHISNTPKQILLYQALNCSPPSFAHLALILGKDRKKLSKRHGVTSILHFRDQGYLPLALFNFLAQMSWHPGEEERIYRVEEMIESFSLEKISKGSPIYDLDKLEWLNSRLIREMAAEELFPYVKGWLQRGMLWKDELEGNRKGWFLKLIELLKIRSRTVKELAEFIRPFLGADFPLDPAGVEKYLREQKLKELLPKLKDDFARLREFSSPLIEATLRQRAEKEGVKASLFIHALRMLAVGKAVSPGIFDVLELLGKEKTLERMDTINKF